MDDIMRKATDRQVGGAHYRDFAIQPVTFIEKNRLGFLEGCIIKRIARWRRKDGIIDLQKAKHEIDLLIQMHNEENEPVACTPPAWQEGEEPLVPRR